jgi:F0F1-type ATP synthase membrane subunit c/vacuolar-type H+-ATPase subunit K
VNSFDIFLFFYLFISIIMELTVLWSALAIWLAGAWVTVWEALIAKKSLDVFWKNPDLGPSIKPLTILWVALTESAAIYWLVVALLILFTEWLTGIQGISAGLSIGLVWLFAWLCEGWIVVQALDSILRNPTLESEIKSNMILYIALVESAAIYALVTALLILFS